MLTGGQVADITGAASLLADPRDLPAVIADKAYDADHLRAHLASRKVRAVIPNKANRVRLYPFDAEAYRSRNIIERTFCRLKDFRAIATRYDKLARNFMAGLALVVAICYWIN